MLDLSLLLQTRGFANWVLSWFGVEAIDPEEAELRQKEEAGPLAAKAGALSHRKVRNRNSSKWMIPMTMEALSQRNQKMTV